MNTRNTFKMRLLAITVLVFALMVSVSVSAQKPPKDAKKQEQTEQKKEKEPKQTKEPKETVQKEPKQAKEPKESVQKEPKQAKEPKESVQKEPKQAKEPKESVQKEPKQPKEPKETVEKEPKEKGVKQPKEEKEQVEKKEKSKTQQPAGTTLVTDEELPPALLKAYKKRYASAENPVWNFYKDEQVYRVSCVYRGVPTVLTYTSDGIWLESLEEYPIEKLSSACVKTINMYYQDYKISSLKKQTTSSKEDMFIVGIYEKQNIKKKLETQVYLELGGGYIRSEDPAETDTKSIDNEQVADKKLSKEEKRLEKELAKEAQSDDAHIKITNSELPFAIQRWVSINYPEYIYKDIAYEEYEEFEKEGRIYQILIQRNGINQPYATVWFTRNGDFLKLEDNFKNEETPVETPEYSKEKTSKEKTVREKEPKAQKETVQKEEEERMFSVDETDVKQEIMAAFKAKYPRAKNVSWSESEGGNFVASYTDINGENVVLFSNESNEWVQTKTLLPDVNKIPSAIRNYIVKNHPKKLVVKGWMVKSAEATKPYYIVELYTKKGKITEYMEFLQNGKLKE